MKPICVIPARGGSKGVSKKNIRPIMGKPLIAYTIESALKSKIFSHVIVSTEDPKIASISKKYGAEVPFMRPKKLAGDSIPMNQVLLHAIKNLLALNYKFEIFVWRDCTVPFIRNRDISASINLLKKQKCKTVIGVYKQHLNPYYNIVEKNSKGFLKLVKKPNQRPTSRQQAPIVYQMNGLHTFDVKKFLKSGKMNLSESIPYEIPIETGLMIDTEYEFQIAKLFIENRLFK